MKILHIVRDVTPAQGGPIEGVKQLGAAGNSAGHQVEVASLDAPGAPFLSTFPLPLHPLGPARLRYGYCSRLVPWLRENARKYDVVVVNGIWQYQSFGTWRVLRNSSTPYVVFTHGQLSPWFKRNHPLKHLKKWLYWPWAEYRVLRDAGAVIFTCEEERRLARDSFWLYSARERVIKYGTAGPANVPDLQMAAFFEQFSGLRGKRIILFMGRLHQIKGCDLAIRAFADQCRSDPKWHLVFCGPDSCGLQPKLARLAGRLGVAHRITWAGMIGGDLKWGAIRCADVFFLPSHQESFGMVVAEALACGVPVLISNKVNIWREIEADGAGLVEDDTSSGSSALLHRWTELSDAEQATMRVRAKQCFESRFAIKAASASLLSVLSTVSGKSQNASA